MASPKPIPQPFNYPLTVVSGYRDPASSAEVRAEFEKVSNLQSISITEICIDFDDNATARPMYIQFKDDNSGHETISEDNLNTQVQRRFYFCPVSASANILTWASSLLENGLIEIGDAQSFQRKMVAFELRDATTLALIPFAYMFVKFNFQTRGPKLGMQSQLRVAMTEAQMRKIKEVWGSGH